MRSALRHATQTMSKHMDWVAALCLLCAAAMAAPSACAAGAAASSGKATELAKRLIEYSGVTRGLCSMPDTDDPALALAVARSSDLVVHAMSRKPEVVAAGRKAAAEAGLLGDRVFFDLGSAEANPLTSRYADLLILTRVDNKTVGALPTAEILRVLTPGGRVVIGCPSDAGKLDAAALAKQLLAAGFARAAKLDDSSGNWCLAASGALAGAGDWPMWRGGPDNNVFSPDTALHQPFELRFIDVPYTVPDAVTLAAGGRFFYAEGAPDPAYESIVARNGYNGLVLWKHPFAWSREQSENKGDVLVASDRFFYCAEGPKVHVLDAVTGEEDAPVTFADIQSPIRLLSLSDGVLLALGVTSGTATVAAHDVATHREIWSRTGLGNVMPSYFAARDGRVVYYALGQGVAALDIHTGKEVWANRTEALLKVLDGTPKPPMNRRRLALGNSPGLVLTPKIVSVHAAYGPDMTLLATADGSLLQTYTNGLDRGNLHLAYSPQSDHLYTVLTKTDPATGKPVPAPATLDGATGAKIADGADGLDLAANMCARLTLTADSVFSQGGPGSLNRGACTDGKVIASGVVYTVATANCRCTSILRGVTALSSAATSATLDRATPRLETPTGAADATVKPLAAAAGDWAEYRAGAGRSAATAASVPAATPPLLWHGPASTSPAAQPAAAGGRVFLARRNGAIECLDAAEGKPAWAYYTGGAVRLPPTLSDSRLYAGSADGYVYCLEAATGRLLWRFQPDMGPQRLVRYFSTLSASRPVNSGVLVRDGVAYAVAGLIAPDGVCAMALDARTGAPRWMNARLGTAAGNPNHPSGLNALGGLAASGEDLWMATGRSQPAPVALALADGSVRKFDKPITAPFYASGREVMVFGDWVLFGGNYLEAANDRLQENNWGFGRPLTWSFHLAADRERALEVQPFHWTAMPPAWDADLFVAATSFDGEIYGWKPAALDGWLRAILDGSYTTEVEKSPLYGGPDHQVARLNDAAFRKVLKPNATLWGPLRGESRSMALAANAVLVTMRDLVPEPAADDAARGRAQAAAQRVAQAKAREAQPWSLRALDRATGAELWRAKLPAQPQPDGLSLDAAGRVFVTLETGEVLCFGGKR